MPRRVGAKGHEVPLSASVHQALNRDQNLASPDSLAHVEDEVREFFQYLDKEGGVIKSASQAGSACSPDYLEAILNKLELFQVWCFLRDDHELPDIEPCLSLITIELKRLQENPELYPNKAVQRDFLQLVRKACDGIAKALQDTKLLRQANKAYSKFFEDFNQAEVVPNHDGHRTPWQQFLHNHAPGSGIEGLRTMGKGCAYLFPPAGVRVVSQMYQALQSAVHDIQALSDDPAGTIPRAGRVNQKISVEGNFRIFQQSLTAVRPTITGSAREARGVRPTRLETLNADFAALDEEERPQRSINLLSIRIHELPSPPAFQEEFRVANFNNAAAKLFD